MSTPTIDITQSAPDDFVYQIRRSGSAVLLNPLFWAGVATAGSAFRFLRFEISGLAFHPYMLTFFLLLFRAIPRIHCFPARIGRPAGLFFFLYTISLIQGTSFVIQLTKISVMAITLILITVSVRSRDDFIAGALGLGTCAALLCIRGFIKGPGEFGSINPIEGSQKNAFSLFYLPALTLCLGLLFSGNLPIQRRSALALIVALIFSGVALSSNRSGWLTSGTLVFLLFSTNRQRLRMAMFLAIAGFLAFVIAEIVTVEAGGVSERASVNAAQSDNLRFQLIVRAITIGLQHPILGVSPTRLTRMLGDIEKVGDEGIDCHNVTGYLIGGCGLVTFAAYCLLAFVMLRPPTGFNLRNPSPLAAQSARILSIMTVGWIIRSQFQEDVLFSPTFTVGLGLCIGFCACSGVYKTSTEAVDVDYA
jgi:O-Antigen ligase